MLWTWANIITIMRILLILPFVICMLSINSPQIGFPMRMIALGIFVIMSFSDALDGYLARTRRQVSRLGSFLDPMADKLLITCACILLTVEATSVKDFRLPGAVVVLIIGKDLLLALGFVVVYFLTDHIRISTMLPGKLSTFFQLAMVLSILIGPEMRRWLSGWPIFVHILWTLAAGMAVLAVTVYIYNGIRYIERFEQDTRKPES